MNNKEIADIRAEAVAALRKVMGHHTTSPSEIIQAAELLLVHADEFDPTPARRADFSARGVSHIPLRPHTAE